MRMEQLLQFMEFLAAATIISQYVDFSAVIFNPSSATNCINYCRKVFSTTTDETFLCLTFFFLEYRIPALSNCLVDTVLLPVSQRVSYLADGLYGVISSTTRLQVENDSNGLPVSISALKCQTWVIRPSCLSRSTVAILYLPQTWTFVKPGPSCLMHLLSSHLLWLQFLIHYFPPASISTCIRLAMLAEKLLLAYSWSLRLCATSK